MYPIKIDVEQLEAFLTAEFTAASRRYQIDTLTKTGIRVKLISGSDDIRPGGTISGPSIFGLADVAIYLAILSRIGIVPMAVTTNANVSFFRKAEGATDLICDVRILKIGRRLATADALILDAHDREIAHTSMTYALPDPVASEVL